jgi:hypothetical protein
MFVSHCDASLFENRFGLTASNGVACVAPPDSRPRVHVISLTFQIYESGFPGPLILEHCILYRILDRHVIAPVSGGKDRSMLEKDSTRHARLVISQLRATF